MKYARVFLILPLIYLAACAHHRDVRPGPRGVNRVLVKTDDTEAGSQDAIRQANHFCESKRDGGYAVFLKEQSRYEGDLDEQTYKNTKRFAKVAQVAGNGLWVFGGKGTSEAGGLASLGGSAANAALGKGYAVDMKFKCRN